MDIHFCDLCGVRVTDVDLRGGHGIRKHYDVICATCLELGHGKEWLARHQRSKSAAVSSQPVRPPTQVTVITPAVAAAIVPAVATALATPAIITHARDRIETFEEEAPSPRVAPQVVSAEETPEHVDVDELNADDHADAADVTDVTDAQQQDNHFAAAASSFSALAQPGRVSTTIADVEDDAQQGEGLKDESTAAPILADEQLGHHGFSDSPFDFTDDTKKERTAQKDETLPVDGAPRAAAKPGDKPAAKKSSSGVGSSVIKNAAAGKKSSQANSKSANARSSSAKGPARKVNKNKNILMMSALSLGILTMILLIVISQNSKRQPQQQTIVFDMSQDLRDAIKDAKLAAKTAYESKNVAKMNAAKIKIQEIRPKIDNFEKEVKAKHADKWNEDDYGRYLEVVDWPKTNVLYKTLSDEILKQRDYK